MRRLAILAAVACSAFVGGCVAPAKPRPRVAQFSEAEYVGYEKSGTATVRGQGFMRTRGGDVKTAAGSSVYMNPKTSYSAEWFDAVLRGIPLEPADQRIVRYHRVTQADAEGRFEFSALPAGTYYVVTTVSWEAPVGYRGALVSQGGYVGAEVTVVDGETKSVVLTR